MLRFVLLYFLQYLTWFLLAEPRNCSGIRTAVSRCVFEPSLGRSFRNKSSNDMAFPHPQSRKDHYRKEDKPSCGGIVRKSFKRTIDIAEYRNAEDKVNPAKNRTL